MKISCTERIAKSKRPSNREAKAGTRSKAIRNDQPLAIQSNRIIVLFFSALP